MERGMSIVMSVFQNLFGKGEKANRLNPFFSGSEGNKFLPDQLNEGDIQIDRRKKPICINYFTDPFGSLCWNIEPQLRKLSLEYGEYFSLEYHMGGLMLENPLTSSYLPAIAFHAAQMQDHMKAQNLLRRMQEMFFLENRNVSKGSNMKEATVFAHLNEKQFDDDFHGNAINLFHADLALAKQMGVKSFPTLIFWNVKGDKEMISGYMLYSQFERTIKKLYPHAKKNSLANLRENIFDHFSNLTTKEYTVLTQQTVREAKHFLNLLHRQGSVKKIDGKKGILWIKNDFALS
jgi:predicted DsbA family dithiol-disulfide isomerase